VRNEATGYFLAIKVDRQIVRIRTRELLRRLIKLYGCPGAIRSDNGSKLNAVILKAEMDKHGIELGTIDPGCPWQNGSNESFNGTFRKECLNAEVFASLTEARVMIEKSRQRYNEHRPHSSQKYITPTMAYFGLRSMSRP